MRDTLNSRGKQILEAIIEDYISTAEPVGSRTISRRCGMDLSPATIRNVMSDLEEMGFLASPHTSAGRIPTDKAYRLYVDSLLEVRTIGRGEREQIKRHCDIRGKQIGDVLKETSRMLSSISNYMGVVATPHVSANVFRHVEFVRLSGRRILAIFVLQNGTVQNRIVETDADLSPADLVTMGNYLTGALQGLTLAEVKQRIVDEMASDKARYDILLARALELSRQSLPDDAAELFIEGQANIMELPEFADIERMKDIFRAFEQKGHLVQLLDRCLSAPGINIFIGSESRLGPLSGMSLITSTYVTGKNTLGVLGVIGPTRMGYGRVIPIVDYTAKLVSRVLEMD